MTLLAVFDSARSALAANALQTAVVSRNVAHVGDAAYAHKSALLATRGDGSAAVAGVGRAADTALQRSALDAASLAAAKRVVSAGYEGLSAATGGSDTAQSLARTRRARSG